VKERDPYRRLGIDAEASYEEVQDARNYLVDTYRGHSAGVESIEAAFDRIIQDKLNTRKKAKGLRLARKKERDPNYVPPFLERLKSRFERPDDQTIVRRAVIYAIMAGWAIVQSTSSGPAFQMAISFGLTVYFLHEKRGKNKDLLGQGVRQRVRRACTRMARREYFPRVHSHLPERVGTGTHPVALLVRRVLRVRDVPEVIVTGAMGRVLSSIAFDS
jgi:hypothetical protein